MEKIISIIKKSKKPVTPQEIASKLHARHSEIAVIKKMLDKYVKEGRIIKKNDRYSFDNELIEGRICATLSGADFFNCEDLSEDLKVVKSKDFCAMHNDTVLVKKRGKNCQIVKILKRGNERIVGTVYRDGTTLYVVPDEKRIHEFFILPKGKRKDAREGDKIVAVIKAYPTKRANGVCSVVENLGSSEDDSTAILSVLYNYGIRQEFPQSVVNEADNIPETIEKKGYK